MTESIWIAIIGAVGVIGAAIIGLFKKSDKSKSNAKTTVNQTVTGNHKRLLEFSVTERKSICAVM